MDTPATEAKETARIEAFIVAFALAFVNAYAGFGVCMLAVYWAITGFEPAAARTQNEDLDLMFADRR